MQRIGIIAGLSVLAAYILWLATFASGMPFWDDLDAHLRFLLSWIDAPSFQERMRLLLTRSEEHYMITNKAATLVDYYLFGTVNFLRLIAYGNLLLILAAIIFASRKWDHPWRALWALTVLLIPQYPQSSLWATGALQNFSSFLWVLTAFVFAGRDSLMAIPFLLAAVFSQGNGVLAIAAWGAMELLRGRRKAAMLYLAAAFVLIVPFLHSPRGSAHPPSSLLDVGLYFFTVLGAAVGPTAEWSAAIGVILLVGGLWSMRATSDRDPLLCALFIWLVATAGTNAFARVSFGTDYGFEQSRYRTLGLYLVVTVCMMTWELLRTQRARRVLAILAGLCLCDIILWKLPSAQIEATFRRQSLTKTTIRYNLFGTGVSYPTPGNTSIHEADRAGLIVLPPLNLAPHIGEPQPVKDLPVASSRIVQRLERVLCSKKYLYVEGYAFHKRTLGRPTIVVMSNGSVSTLRPDVDVRPDVVNNHHRPEALQSGVHVIIPVESLGQTAGEVRLGVTEPDGAVKVAQTGKTFTLPCTTPDTNVQGEDTPKSDT